MLRGPGSFPGAEQAAEQGDAHRGEAHLLYFINFVSAGHRAGIFRLFVDGDETPKDSNVHASGSVDATTP